jgi:hypothetical protein
VGLQENHAFVWVVSISSLDRQTINANQEASNILRIAGTILYP